MKVHHLIETTTVTPAMAIIMLEANKINRPLRQGHVRRIANQITEGKWQFNGDTIKIADTEDVLDGQHRLWAVIEANAAIETIVVRGIKKEAFSTIDTIRQSRTHGDVLARLGAKRYRVQIGGALRWLLLYQKNAIDKLRDPQNRVENSDIENAYAAHPHIFEAIERAMRFRQLGPPAIIGFLYYIAHNQNEELAERFLSTLEAPAGIPMSDPFFKFRAFLLAQRGYRDQVQIIALAFKAMNAAYANEKLTALGWRSQGRNPEQFPELHISGPIPKKRVR